MYNEKYDIFYIQNIKNRICTRMCLLKLTKKKIDRVNTLHVFTFKLILTLFSEILKSKPSLRYTSLETRFDFF